MTLKLATLLCDLFLLVADEEDLMISHTHFDRTDADQDINCVFPLTRLKELAAEGIIGGVAPTHYGFMGYIPEYETVNRRNDSYNY